MISAPRWVVPSPALEAAGVRPLASNNNCAIALHEGRLFLAFRTAPIHFASTETRLVVVSSADGGASWAKELEVARGADLREPTLLSFKGALTLRFFEAGTNPFGFEPRAFWRTTRLGPGRWSELASAGDPGEVPWEAKVRRGVAWQTSYRGNHYAIDAASATVDLFFKRSEDGATWAPVDPANPVIYRGGASECAFEFANDGSLVAVTRLEDGDASGFGSHLARAPAGDLGRWRFPARASPSRYDSPRMFRHGRDLFLLARRDVGGPFDMGLDALSFAQRRAAYLAAYSIRPKRTALYAIDAGASEPRWIADLPSAGDTAFPSVVRAGAHRFLVANYTSPPEDPGRSWIRGQVSAEGTRIYLLDIDFVAK